MEGAGRLLEDPLRKTRVGGRLVSKVTLSETSGGDNLLLSRKTHLANLDTRALQKTAVQKTARQKTAVQNAAVRKTVIVGCFLGQNHRILPDRPPVGIVPQKS